MSFERVSTGNVQLDEILGGGFPKNSINIVMGHPGTGKTILAQQLVFHNADGDRPILYLTTLSEPLSKVITYLQRFSFYDEGKLLGSVVYEDVGEEITTRGVDSLVTRVSAAIRDIGPKIIIIDSFKAIGDLTDSPSEMRRVSAQLAGVLSAYDATVFLIGEYAEDQIPLLPEFAIADGVIELARRGTIKRDERFLRVFKLRGSGYAEGVHAFRITGNGLQVYPRLVTPELPASYTPRMDRLESGIPGLDALLDGGLVRGSTGFVSGPPGTGKTTFALQFAIAGVHEGKRSLYLNFQENPSQLARTVKSLGADLEELKERGFLFQYESPVELRIDSVVIDMFRIIRENNVERVVIDGLSDLSLAAADRERFHDYLYSICQHVIASGTTMLMTVETPTQTHVPSVRNDADFSSMVDVIVELRLQMRDPPVRTIRIAKARGVAHDLRFHEMVIERGGMRVKEALNNSDF